MKRNNLQGIKTEDWKGKETKRKNEYEEDRKGKKRGKMIGTEKKKKKICKT